MTQEAIKMGLTDEDLAVSAYALADVPLQASRLGWTYSSTYSTKKGTTVIPFQSS